MTEQFVVTIEKVEYRDAGEGVPRIKIFEQTVETLDVNAVFAAINKPVRKYVKKAKGVTE